MTLSISLLFATMIIKMSDLGKYHAAEHMTDLSFEYNGSIELIDVAKHSRVHSKCGTNIVVFVFLFNLLFSFFDMNIYISIALSFSLAYEVFQIPSKYLKPFLGIGAIIQFVLFTSKPSSVHLKVAKASYEALIREEENYRNVKQNNPTD
ncbi:DUF1385 domain-containing protein [Bacillus sp. JCM 19034]|uniref:DUF1385 domain-containing protein n=1 Tax=Bacillus sp. JCM 19034 TaxID=1481928 RepID=UPI00078439E4